MGEIYKEIISRFKKWQIYKVTFKKWQILYHNQEANKLDCIIWPVMFFYKSDSLKSIVRMWIMTTSKTVKRQKFHPGNKHENSHFTTS